MLQLYWMETKWQYIKRDKTPTKVRAAKKAVVDTIEHSKEILGTSASTFKAGFFSLLNSVYNTFSNTSSTSSSNDTVEEDGPSKVRAEQQKQTNLKKKAESVVNRKLHAFNKYPMYVQWLMAAVPNMEMVIIDMILSYICTNDLCIYQHASLNPDRNTITFKIQRIIHTIAKSVDIPDCEYIEVAVMNSSPFSTQVLHKLKQKISGSTNDDDNKENTDNEIECIVTFRNDYNSLMDKHYFILTACIEPFGTYFPWRNQTKSDEDIWCHILCQFVDNDRIKLLHEIKPEWNETATAEPNTSFSRYRDYVSALRGFRIKFDCNYIYVVKGRCISIFYFDESNNRIIPVSHELSQQHSVRDCQVYDSSILADMVNPKGKQHDGVHYLMVAKQNYTKLELYQIGSDRKIALFHTFELSEIFAIVNNTYTEIYDTDGYAHTYKDDWLQSILSFKYIENSKVMLVYYNSSYNRLFAIFVKLSLVKPAELVNYILLDGKIGRGGSTTTMNYTTCYGIEQIYVNKEKHAGLDPVEAVNSSKAVSLNQYAKYDSNGDVDAGEFDDTYWLIYCQHYNQGCFHMVRSEAEFKVNLDAKRNIMWVEYGKLKQLHAHLDHEHIKQFSLTKFIM